MLRPDLEGAAWWPPDLVFPNAGMREQILETSAEISPTPSCAVVNLHMEHAVCWQADR